jgi:peptidyl-prolyl cis-trans isomerase C
MPVCCNIQAEKSNTLCYKQTNFIIKIKEKQMKNRAYMLVMILALAILPGCAGDKAPEGTVLATVNNENISQDDILKQMKRIPEWARPQLQDAEGKSKFLDEMIKRELIYQEAARMKLNNDEEFKAQVKEFEKMTLVQLILKKEVDEKVKLDKEEAKKFFDQNADKLTVGTKIKASHILVETEKEANDIIDKINKGKGFADLARSLSKDSVSAKKGGDLGYFGRGQMVPEFESAALSLKPGEVSKPVRTRFGFHIIKLIEIKKGEPAKFEESKEAITRQITMEKRKKLFDKFIDRLKAGAKITQNDDAIAALPLPWEPAAPAPSEAPPASESTEKK